MERMVQVSEKVIVQVSETFILQTNYREKIVYLFTVKDIV